MMEDTKHEQVNEELPRVHIQIATHTGGLTIKTMDIEIASHNINECIDSLMYLNKQFNLITKKSNGTDTEHTETNFHTG